MKRYHKAFSDLYLRYAQIRGLLKVSVNSNRNSDILFLDDQNLAEFSQDSNILVLLDSYFFTLPI